ncbi:MAG TPA: DMT family transporter [Polyangiaceae bacterium]|mgnify:CR=1 FL=1|nr:DMT family transporter [Polyangiaceae bacterium]HMR76155.1 DMT family transporter [Polyangiaceae bacterium]
MSQPVVIAVVLVAALLHASWNAIVKHSGDRLLTFAVVIGTGGVIAVPLAFFVTPPAAASHPHLATSAGVHLVYYAFLLLGYRYGDLGQVYPIARGTGPLVVALASGPLAAERLGMLGAIGLLMVSGGIVALAGRGSSKHAVGFAFGTGLCIGAYSLADGLGARQSGTPLGYIVWLHLAIGIPFASAVLILKRKQVPRFLVTHGRRAVIGGLIAVLAYSLVIWAMSETRLAYVASLRETSVVLAAIIGAVWLDEPFGKRRIMASVVVAAGIVLMSIPV